MLLVIAQVCATMAADHRSAKSRLPFWWIWPDSPFCLWPEWLAVEISWELRATPRIQIGLGNPPNEAVQETQYAAMVHANLLKLVMHGSDGHIRGWFSSIWRVWSFGTHNKVGSIVPPLNYRSTISGFSRDIAKDDRRLGTNFVSQGAINETVFEFTSSNRGARIPRRKRFLHSRVRTVLPRIVALRVWDSA